MESEELRILCHAINVDENGKGPGNGGFFGVRPDDPDYARCQSLEERNLMFEVGQCPAFNDRRLFKVTRDGFAAAKSSGLKALAADLLIMVEELSGESLWPRNMKIHRIECEQVAHLINRARDMLKT